MLITGGRRVGGALALLLADRGGNVALTYHTSREAIEQTVAEVEARGVAGLADRAPTSREPTRPSAAVAQVVERFGRLDVLVNMASVFRRTPLASLAPGRLRRDDRRQPRRPLPHGRSPPPGGCSTQPGEDGIKGKIVNVGDWATERPYKDYLPYLVAKGGLTTMTLALADGAGPAHRR